MEQKTLDELEKKRIELALRQIELQNEGLRIKNEGEQIRNANDKLSIELYRDKIMAEKRVSEQRIRLDLENYQIVMEGNRAWREYWRWCKEKKIAPH